MKVRTNPQSGRRANVVAFKSRYGQCEREHVPPGKRRTAAQRHSQSEFGDASLGWNDLTDEQRDAWREFGKTVLSHPRGGQCGPLSGQALFTAINRNQRLLGLPPLLWPPMRPAFPMNPVRALAVNQGSGGIALKLNVAGAPAGHVLVFASRPYNAGRKYCDKFIYLGPLPAPVGGESDITEQYLKKHGPPWPGSRVIILTVQQVDGWRDEPQRIEAVFQRKQGPAASQKRRRAPVAAP
jgi:hypothetical protein